MEYDIESILEKYEDDYNPGPRPMAQGGRIGFNEGLKVAAEKANLDSRAKSILEYQDKFGKKTLDNIAQTKYEKNFSQLNTDQLNNLKRRVVKFEDFIKENNRMPTEDEARKTGRKDRTKTIFETGTKEVTEKDVRNKLKKNNKYAETFKGKVIFADKNIQNNFEDELTKRYSMPRTSSAAEKAGVLSNKELYEKFLKPGYSESSARTIIDNYKKSLNVDFKELSLEEKEAKKIEREKLEKISQGGKRISGTVDNPAHHMFPLGDDIGAKAGEFTIIPKKINGQIAYANKLMKKLTEERRNLLNQVRIDQTVNIKDLDKQLANINNKADEVIKNHYKKYPSHEGLLNWKKIDFVTDDVGRLLNVRQVGTIGGDYKKWTLNNIDKTIVDKNIAKLNADELKGFRNVIKEVSDQRDIKPTKLFNPINQMQLDVPAMKRLAAIGCPGKAMGGRIGFFEGQNLNACATKGVEKLKGDPGKLTSGDQANLRAISKSAKAARILKNVLGPAAILGEVLVEGGIAANKFMSEGVPIKQALGESYINKYLLGPKTQIDVEAERAKEFAKGEDFAMAERGRRMAPFMAQSKEADAQRLKKREQQMEQVFPTISPQQIDEILKARDMTIQDFGMTYPQVQDFIKQDQQMQAIADAGGVANLAEGGIASLNVKK